MEGEVDDAVINVSVSELTDNSNKGIARLRAEGYNVDDDNKPTPENIYEGAELDEVGLEYDNVKECAYF